MSCWMENYVCIVCNSVIVIPSRINAHPLIHLSAIANIHKSTKTSQKFDEAVSCYVFTSHQYLPVCVITLS